LSEIGDIGHETNSYRIESWAVDPASKVVQTGGYQRRRPIILEERDNELVLKPAMVLAVEMYTDTQVSAWDEADRIEDAERQSVLQRLATRQ